MGLEPAAALRAADAYHQSQAEAIMRDFLTILWKRPRQRDITALAFDGYTNREIADVLGIRPDNVRSTLRHARATLKPLLADDDRRSGQVADQVREAFQSGETLPVAPRPVITLAWWFSWILGVKPEQDPSVKLVDPDELTDRRERSPMARSGALAALNELAATTDQMMAVTDAHGVVLWRGGDHRVMRAADEIGFVAGARWDISHAGANGIALALAAEQLVTVCRAEHYLRTHRELSCGATPVTGQDGQVLFVLNLTGTRATMHRSVLRELDTIARRLRRQLINDSRVRPSRRGSWRAAPPT
jgi:transcriptional regulator of acetoin/glycerol metabolism